MYSVDVCTPRELPFIASFFNNKVSMVGVLTRISLGLLTLFHFRVGFGYLKVSSIHLNG